MFATCLQRMDQVVAGDSGAGLDAGLDAGLKNAAAEVPSVEKEAPRTCVGESDDISDSELDELLDESLGEFGKHLPSSNQPSVKPSPSIASNVNAENLSATNSNATPNPLPQTSEFDDIFSSAFVADAESQLGDAMKALSDENPELWQQFETFAKSMGLENMGMEPAPPPSTTATKGESSVDSGGTKKEEEGSARKSEGSRDGKSTLDQKLDETLRKLQDNTAQLGAGPGNLGGLDSMLNQLDLDSEEGEDQFMKMMEGMMSTLISKDVLYPSLLNLCQLYPDWLSSHREEVSEEDYQRYSKQFEIISLICREFEKEQPEATAEESSQAGAAYSSDNVVELMQQLRHYGSPPEDFGEGSMPGEMPGIPAGLQDLMGNSPNPQNCSVM